MRLTLPILGLLLLGGCEKLPETEAAASAPAVAPPLQVAVRKPLRQRLRRDASLTAEFRAYQQVDLHAKIAGYLKEIHVDAGSRVRAGDLIAVLEAPELQAEVNQAAAARSRAESELQRAQAEVSHVEASVELARAFHQRLLGVNKVEGGLIAQQEIDEAAARRRSAEAHAASARAGIAAAEHQLEAARAAEKRVQAMLDYTRVLAPFAGVIVKRMADPGAMIQAGVASHSQALPLVRLAELARLRLVANVPETVVGRLRLGQTADIRVGALGLSLTGKLARFTGNVQANSRTAEVEIDVANPSQSILPGMSADVILPIDTRPDALTIPMQALSELGGNRYVLVAAQGALEERQIQTGFEGATEVEVLAGLSDNDQVVISSKTMLRPGMKVEAKLEVVAR